MTVSSKDNDTDVILMPPPLQFTIKSHCGDLREQKISPRRVIYKKHRLRNGSRNLLLDIYSHTATRMSYCVNLYYLITTRILRAKHRSLTRRKLMFIFLILINQVIQPLGISSTSIAAEAATATGNSVALRMDDLFQNDGHNIGDGSSSSDEDSDGILISSNLNSDSLNSSNNKTLSPFSLSSSNLVTAAAIGDNPPSPVVINGGSNSNAGGSNSGIGTGGHYLDKIDNLERSVAAVLIKVAYGTTSTTKRSIPDNSYVPSLTTIATPPLTTLRYLEKSQHQQQINLHHRNYELDLERDHALPTSAPNADILKSNSNPTYPNPNRHHNHDRDRDRHRHLVTNSTPPPSIHNLQKKGPPTNPMYSIDMPSYSPPARSFLTPPLPPEYTNPFADKPTLRGTNNDGGISSVGGGGGGGGTYINRRPIPPPSLMPGQERIPLRPPDLNGGITGQSIDHSKSQPPTDDIGTTGQRKKALNTPSIKVNNKVDSPTFEKSSGVAANPGGAAISDSAIPNEGINPTNGGVNNGGSVIHFQGISRILSGSNGRKEDIPEVLLRTATVRPNNSPQQSPISHQQAGNGQNPNINQSKNGKSTGDSDDNPVEVGNSGASEGKDPGGNIASDRNRKNNNDNPTEDENTRGDDYDNFDIFVAAEPQPKIKMSTKSTENPYGGENVGPEGGSTQVVHNVGNNHKSLLLTTSTPSGGSGVGNEKDASTKSTVGSAASGGGGGGGNSSSGGATWTVAWNIHVYLSAILFTILAVYSIFKMIFYDKLTHLFNQSYFICIHLILIVICMTRIFYLCYDAYNIHSSFHLFVSEILLNLPATFLTISFSVLILFLLIRSLNHKNNRYSALIRPLTVVVGSSVHVGLCITLHYVESYTTANNQQLYYQQQLYRSSGGTMAGSVGRLPTVGTVGHTHHSHHHHHHQLQVPPSPPRVLSLICQIIYIFVCLSLGLLYLYLYRILKRVLRSKSQNYIHGYQNLSYAIHITIATALLFVLLAALQIYGALSISTTRPLITVALEIDWLQWGYQFSLRLIEIAIITLMSWVAGLKTGGNSGVLQREKAAGGDTHNVSGFALFPCTSSSSQEHFETDYPAVCNANTNLHTYTLRTGKPIYDDNFALNSLTGGAAANSSSSGGSGGGSSNQSNITQQQRLQHDFQLQNAAPGGDFVRSYETSSLRSASHHFHHNHSPHILDAQSSGGNVNSFLCDSQTDHYENPNFELRPATSASTRHHHHQDNCYSEPSNPYGANNGGGDPSMLPPNAPASGYDFQDFERPIFGNAEGPSDHHPRPNSRNDCHLLSKSAKSQTGSTRDRYQQQQNILDRASYENPERRSTNSTHSCGSARNYPTYNSFERRNGGVRKSGTLNNIGNIMHGGQIGGRNNSTSSSSSSSHRPSGVQTLSSTHNRTQNSARNGPTNNGANIVKQQTPTSGTAFYRGSDRSHHHHHRSSLERSNSSVLHQPHHRQLHQQQYAIPSSDDADDFCCPNPERATLINNSSSSGGLSGCGVPGGVVGNCPDNNRAGVGCLTLTTNGGNLADGVNGGSVAISAGSGGGGGGATCTSTSSSGGDSANSGSMLVAEHGFVRFRALDDMNNAQGVGIHNASIRATTGGSNSRHKEKPRCFTNNT